MKITKKILGALLALVSSAALATTLSPVSLLNPGGSTSGQAILSTGPSSAPAWGSISAAALTGVLPVANGGTNASAASGTSLDNITGFSGTGFLTRTGAGTYAFQSLTNGVTLANLAQASANTVLANATGATANVAAFGMPSCSSSTSALQWTSGTGFTCYGNSASLTGSTFTGTVALSYTSPIFSLNDTSGSGFSEIDFRNAGVTKWGVGSNTTSTAFYVNRSSGGVYVDTPLQIDGTTGLATFADGISSNSSSNALTGGAINNASIGASTASTGAFTTLSANSTVTGFIGRLINVQIFSSSGTYTPTTGTASVVITVQGSGGGGGGAATTTSGQTAAAGGGGSGSYAKARFTSGFTGGIAVTVPSGGAGGTAGANNGTAGSAASIGSLISCSGGMAGAGAAAATSAGYVGGGGRSATCTITGAAETLANLGGNAGLYGIVLSSTSSLSGAGGNSLLGDAGGQTVGNNAGLAGAGCGSGGSGGVTTVGSAVAGGNGAAACVEVDEYSN